MKELLQKIRSLNVLVLGDVMLDHYLWGDAQRLSPEAPVPVVDIQRDTYTAGGAANVALNLRSLGARAEIGGWIGRDEAGRRLRRLLRERGVKFDAGLFTSARPTIVKTRVIVQHQQLCRLDREGGPDDYHFDLQRQLPRLEKRLGEFQALIFSDYAKGLLGEEMIERLAAAARERGLFVALDPKPKRPLRFRDLDLITPNKREALQLAGIEPEAHRPFPAKEVCQRIYKRYRPRLLVVTLGEQGMLLSEKGKVVSQIPTAAREVYDVSGAGDTVIATLALALAAGAALEEAAHVANAAAGVVVAKLGTATVAPDELLAALDNPPAAR